MKHISLACYVLVIGAAINAHAGTFVTGQSLDFSSNDFASGNTASQEIVINTSSGPDTDVYAETGLGVTSDGRVAPEDASGTGPFTLTYEATTPSADLISSFTLGIDDFVPAGTGSAPIYIQYSTDGVNFTAFYTTTVSGPEVTDQQFTVDLPTPSDTLYVQYALDGVSGDTNYFALWSNRDFADDSMSGGANPESFLSVTVVPEPSTYALMMVGVAGLIIFGLRKSKLALS